GGRRVGRRPVIEPGIQSFDCTSTDEVKRGESLRNRRSGGPEGATWNWYGSDLLCTGVVRGGCGGTAKRALDLGRKRAAQAEVPVSSREATTSELRVPASVWQRALQRPKDRVYETLRLRLRVDASCASGAHVLERQTWSDGFTGAFS